MGNLPQASVTMMTSDFFKVLGAPLLERGPGRISPFFIPATIINLASGQVSIRAGAKGPNSATATACTTSAHSIGDSFRMIQRGDAIAVVMTDYAEP